MKPQTQLSFHIRMVAIGTWLGFVLACLGFTHYDELHKMFVFSDLRLLLAFGGGMSITMAVFAIIRMKGLLKVHIPIHKGTIPGGVLFGAGWALAAACPAVPIIQLGEGQLPAIVTIVGLVLGMYLAAFVQRRFLGWDSGSCAGS